MEDARSWTRTGTRSRSRNSTSASANPVEYAQCVKMLGNGRLEAKCQDGETRLGQIRGQMRKKVCQARPIGRLV